MQIKCGCKINLRLKILARRPDGYHNLETIFYPLPYPFDLINILSSCDVRSGITVHCTTEGIDLQNNTLTKAYSQYANYTNFSPSLELELVKNIPHGAGLGGGSSNAASLLLYLQSINSNPISQAELINVAANVGADVPFFLLNKPCKAYGIGEILHEIDLDLQKFYLLLINPYIKISTKDAFKKLAEQKKCLTADRALVNYQPSQFLQDISCENDFEEPTFLAYPKIGHIKHKLLESGAQVALLSGSGSCLFGIFENLKSAEQCKSELMKFFSEEELEIYQPFSLKKKY